MKAYETGQHPQRRCRGTQRRGQDPVGRRAPVHRRCNVPGSAGWTTERRSPTTTTKKSLASTRSRPRLPGPSGTRPRSTSSTRRGSATSSPTRAPACAWPTPRWSPWMPSPASKCRPRRSGPRPSPSRLPRLVVVNRLDRERASLERTLGSLREFCSRAVVPIQIPLGEERRFTGVVDLLSMKAWTFATDGSGKATEGQVPPELYESAQSARDALVEMVAEADDALMERFFETGTLTQEELVSRPANRDAGRQDLPARVRVRADQCRGAAAPRPDRVVRAEPARASVHGRARRSDGDDGA